MIATYDQQIDGKWYRVGEKLPSEEPVKAEPTPVAEKPEEPKKVPAKKSGKKV